MSDLLSYCSQNFRNIWWDNCCLWENVIKYNVFLEISKKDKVDPMAIPLTYEQILTNVTTINVFQVTKQQIM